MNLNNYENITLEAGKSAVIIEKFTQGSGKKTITVEEGAQLNYLLIASETCNIEIDIITTGPSAKIHASGLLLTKAGADVTVRMISKLATDKAQADMHLVSLLGE